VGHETDFTIADFVADMRAPTPSAAAEMVAAHEAQLCSLLATLTTNLARSMQFRIDDSRTQVQELALSPAFDAVAARLHGAMAASGDAEHRLQTAITSLIQRAQRRVGAATHGLSPVHLSSAVLAARTRFDSLNKARDAGIVTRLETAKQRLAMAAAGLDALSPLKVLERGYAIAHDADGHVVRAASALSIGDSLRLRLWQGAVDCRVEGTEEK
jgi:exodeoxyribonuclease VII large subunit